MRSLLALTILAALPASGGEYAVLSNGFRLRIDRHETAGADVRLISGNGETLLPANQIARFEADEPASTPPPQPQPEPTPAPAPVTDPRLLVERAALRHGLPPELVHSVAKAESGYRADAVSPKGAIGVMQLMPTTAAALSADPTDPAQNIDAGSRLLRELLEKYDWSANRALAAYNAGTGAVARYDGVPPYRETQLYVDRVIRDYLRQKSQKSTTRQSSE